MKPEHERLSGVVKDTVSLLIKNGVNYSSQLSIQGLMVVSVDQEELFIVQFNELVGEGEDTCQSCGQAKGGVSSSSRGGRGHNARPGGPTVKYRHQNRLRPHSPPTSPSPTAGEHFSDGGSNDEGGPPAKMLKTSRSTKTTVRIKHALQCEDNGNEDDDWSSSKTTKTIPPSIWSKRALPRNRLSDNGDNAAGDESENGCADQPEQDTFPDDMADFIDLPHVVVKKEEKEEGMPFFDSDFGPDSNLPSSSTSIPPRIMGVVQNVRFQNTTASATIKDQDVDQGRGWDMASAGSSSSQQALPSTSTVGTPCYD